MINLLIKSPKNSQYFEKYDGRFNVFCSAYNVLTTVEYILAYIGQQFNWHTIHTSLQFTLSNYAFIIRNTNVFVIKY